MSCGPPGRYHREQVPRHRLVPPIVVPSTLPAVVADRRPGPGRMPGQRRPASPPGGGQDAEIDTAGAAADAAAPALLRYAKNAHLSILPEARAPEPPLPPTTFPPLARRPRAMLPPSAGASPDRQPKSLAK